MNADTPAWVVLLIAVLGAVITYLQTIRAHKAEARAALAEAAVRSALAGPTVNLEPSTSDMTFREAREAGSRTPIKWDVAIPSNLATKQDVDAVHQRIDRMQLADLKRANERLAKNLETPTQAPPTTEE